MRTAALPFLALLAIGCSELPHPPLGESCPQASPAICAAYQACGMGTPDCESTLNDACCLIYDCGAPSRGGPLAPFDCELELDTWTCEALAEDRWPASCDAATSGRPL